MAKLRADQLETSLKKNLASIYLVSGDEPLLVQEACDSIRSAARVQGFTERELYHSDANFSWDTLNHSANSMSLFAEKKIIEIRVTNGKPGDAGSKAIVEYCQQIPDDTLLLLVFPKIDKRSQNSKWHKAIDAAGGTIPIWPVTPAQLPRWVEKRLQQAGLSVNNQAIEILCAKIEGNLLAAVQEIEKLKLIADNNVIDAQTMANAVMSSARYDVFGLVDKALIGDSRAAVTSLHGLKEEGTEPPVVLWALAREVRTLTTIKESLENGKSFDFAAKSQGVWDNRKPQVKQALSRLPLRQLHALVRKASQVDKTIKGINKGDPWNLLLDMTLSIAGVHALNARSQKLSN